MEGKEYQKPNFSSILFGKSLPVRGFVSLFATIQKREIARISIPRKREVE
jgi:hypothetical protein